VKHLAQSYVRIEAVQAALKSIITPGPSGRLRGDFRQRGSLFPLCDFLRGFILAVFISPSAFFFVTRALRIGVYSGGTPCQGSR